ncbi:winged helix-turn-helix transcriptional regulator [bacterium]|nr:winged helix-turn-helix transcriptional regulator [bacterium]
MDKKDQVKDSTAAQRIALGMTRLGLAMRQQSWQQAGGRGLTPTQGQVLAHLAGQADAQRLGQIVDALALTAATVSECVQVLAEKGLVKKVRDPQDGRALRLSLTPSGRREAQRAVGWPDFLAEAMSSVSEEEQAVMLRGLSKMIRELEGRGQIPPQRMCLSCTHFRASNGKDRRRSHRCTLLDAVIGDERLQLDCACQQMAPEDLARENWSAFIR